MTPQERRFRLQELVQAIKSGQFRYSSPNLEELYTAHLQPRAEYQSSTDRSGYNYGYSTTGDVFTELNPDGNESA